MTEMDGTIKGEIRMTEQEIKPSAGKFARNMVAVLVSGLLVGVVVGLIIMSTGAGS